MMCSDGNSYRQSYRGRYKSQDPTESEETATPPSPLAVDCRGTLVSADPVPTGKLDLQRCRVATESTASFCAFLRM